GSVAAQVDLLADLDLLDRETRARRLQDRQRRVHDLGADPVAARNGDGGLVRHLSLLSAGFSPGEPRRTIRPAATGAKPYHRVMSVRVEQEGLSTLARHLRSASRVTVVTGAGVSAASGIPTFRGHGGIWRSFRPERLATPEAFAEDPHLVWEWYAWRR